MICLKSSLATCWKQVGICLGQELVPSSKNSALLFVVMVMMVVVMLNLGF